MVNLNKIASSKVSEKPAYRFSDWFPFTKPQDRRTRGQLLATINDLANKNPHVKEFVKSLSNMETKYLGLAADTLELAQAKRFMPFSEVDLNKVEKQSGKSLLQKLLKVYPKAAKENPYAMELAQEVINNTDASTSKYFLSNFVEQLSNPQGSEHYKAIKPLVKDIAADTVNNWFPMKEKQEYFVNILKMFMDKASNPEKIRLVQKLAKAADEIPGENVLYLDNFVRSATPIEQVEKNLKTVKEVGLLANAQGKTFDMVDFVNHNVNLD